SLLSDLLFRIYGVSYLFYCYVDHRDLHSFPTRRSSDLLAVGVLLGAVLARAVIPLIMLTSEAARPVPQVLVELPAGRVAVLLAAVAAVPLVVTAVLSLRRADPVTSLRERGGE